MDNVIADTFEFISFPKPEKHIKRPTRGGLLSRRTTIAKRSKRRKVRHHRVKLTPLPTLIRKADKVFSLNEKKHWRYEKNMMQKYNKRKQIGIPSYIKLGSKFHNKPTEYKGKLYHSAKEAEYAMILDDMVRTGEIQGWESQFKLKLEVNGKKICSYIADFLVVKVDLSNLDSITNEIHEVKGYFTPIGKLKWRLAQALYPQYRFVLIQ